MTWHGYLIETGHIVPPDTGANLLRNERGRLAHMGI